MCYLVFCVKMTLYHMFKYVNPYFYAMQYLDNCETRIVTLA